jgi:hypothetical protein
MTSGRLNRWSEPGCERTSSSEANGPPNSSAQARIRGLGKCFETLPRAAVPKRRPKHFLPSPKPALKQNPVFIKRLLHGRSQLWNFLPNTGVFPADRIHGSRSVSAHGDVCAKRHSALGRCESVVGEIHDPSKGSFAFSVLTEFDHSGHSATLLENRKVLVVGGLASPTTAELYP